MKALSAQREVSTQLNIVEVAERLFRQIGFQKTTVADIAGELQMSPANIYRFFSAKNAINEAVGRNILREIERAVAEIARRPGPASKKLRDVVLAIENLNAQRFHSDHKLHKLVETAYNENWAILREHFDALDEAITQIVRQGMSAGEFLPGDGELAAILIRSVCIQFFHPSLLANAAQVPKPTVDQMVDFCLRALSRDE